MAFLNDHAVRIVYAKTPKAGATPRILDDEALAILKGEAHGGKWKRYKKGSVLFGAASGNKVFDSVKSMVYGKPTGNIVFDTAKNRWVNSNELIAYISADGMRLIVDAPEAAMWENAIKQGKKSKGKRKYLNSSPICFEYPCYRFMNMSIVPQEKQSETRKCTEQKNSPTT